MIKLGCLLAVVVLIVIPFVAGQYLPWWGTLLVVVGEAVLLILGIPALLKYGIKRFAMRLFTAKSYVLRDAEVIVHEVCEVPRPESESPEIDDDDEVEDDEEIEIARYIMVDCTISPRPSKGPMQHWDPFELQLCPYDKKTSMSFDEEEDGQDDEGHVVDLASIDLDQGDEEAIEDKIQGSQRVRVVFACPASLVGRAKLRYYFESLGDLSLP